jgi:hypothetical protein
MVSNTDYNNWNNKLDSSSAVSGDLSGTFSAATVNKLQGFPLFVSAPSAGQVLKYNGSNWNNSSINASDIMSGTLPVNRGGTNSSSFGNNHLIASNGTGSAMTDIFCSMNQVISFDASGYAVCSNVGSLAPIILSGGNSMGASVVLGTNDAFPTVLRTNGADRILINPSGQVGIMGGSVGIGTASPTAPLDITGYTMMRGQASATGSSAGQGNFFYNSTKNKFQFSENGGAYFDLLSPGGNAMASSISLGTNDSFPVAIRTNNTDRITVDATGKVGIGTGTPNAPLDLMGFMTVRGQSSASVSTAGQGNFFYNSIKNKFQFSENGGTYFDLLSPNGNMMGQSITVGTGDSYKLNLITNGQARVVVDPTGSVGIGTMIPTTGVALDISSPSSTYALKVSQGAFQGTPIKSITRFQVTSGMSCSPTTPIAVSSGTSCMVSGYNSYFSGGGATVVCSPAGGGNNSKLLTSCTYDGTNFTINFFNLGGSSISTLPSWDVTVINY